MAIEGAKKLGLPMIGMGGQTISQGNEIDILAIVWCLMKFRLLSGTNKKDLVNWVNNRVSDLHAPIKDFSDKSLATGTFLICFISSIDNKNLKQ